MTDKYSMNTRKHNTILWIARNFNMSETMVFKFWLINNSLLYAYRVCKAIYEVNHIEIDHIGMA